MFKLLSRSCWYAAIHISETDMHMLLVEVKQARARVHARFTETCMEALLKRVASYRPRVLLALPDAWVACQEEYLETPFTLRECDYYIETEKTRLFPHITERCYVDFIQVKQAEQWKLAIYAVLESKLFPWIHACRALKLPMHAAEIESMARSRASCHIENTPYQACYGLVMRECSAWQPE